MSGFYRRADSMFGSLTLTTCVKPGIPIELAQTLGSCPSSSSTGTRGVGGDGVRIGYVV